MPQWHMVDVLFTLLGMVNFPGERNTFHTPYSEKGSTRRMFSKFSDSLFGSST
jgi:hypothetical protein